MRGALVTIGLTASLFAQSPAFEVTSVKSMASDSAFGQIGLQPGGRFVASSVPLSMLIRFAYGLEDYQLLGGPGWITAARFEVIATAGRNVSREEALAMLRTLLTDRFALRAHGETRELPVFDLVLARTDGRLGDQLRRAMPPACAPVSLPAGMPPPPPPPPGQASTLPLAPGALRCPSMFAPSWLSARDVTIGQLAVRLAPYAGRPIIDRTGLMGTFDIDLTYASVSPDVTGLGPGAPAPPGAATDRPALPTAISEQLGLRLMPARGPVNVLVIDAAERPTEN